MNRRAEIQNQEVSCEALIIGSGAGGATLAHELSKAGIDALVVEEGSHFPAEMVPDRLSTSFSKMWRSGGMTLAAGWPPVSYAEGKCVGGSTEINSSIFQIPQEELIASWGKDKRLKAFGPESLGPLYEKASRLVNASLTRGELGAHSEILKSAGEKQGWKVTALERGHKNCVGTNHCSIGCPTGAKQSMSNSVLEEFTLRGGQISPDCKVTKLIMKGAKVLHAEAQTVDNSNRKIRVRIFARFFFVCGGATQTPGLLLRSGFKRPVGQGFKIHPTIRVLADFGKPINAHSSRHPLFAITEFLPDIRLGGSVFTLPTFGMFLAEDWSSRQQMADSYANFGMYYAMARGSGIGSVSKVPFSTQSFVKYRLSDRDWRSLLLGLESLSVALFETGAVRIQPAINGVGPWTSVDAMRSSLKGSLPKRACNVMTIHLFCSVAMGEDESAFAADSFGKVHGVENLYVADASLIPDSPGVNPQATVMALSLRVAENFIRQNG